MRRRRAKPMVLVGDVPTVPCSNPLPHDPHTVVTVIRPGSGFHTGEFCPGRSAPAAPPEAEEWNTSMVDLNATTDGAVWAAEFMRYWGHRLGEVDEGLMIGWFANAIEVGRSAGQATPEAGVIAHTLWILVEQADILIRNAMELLWSPATRTIVERRWRNQASEWMEQFKRTQQVTVKIDSELQLQLGLIRSLVQTNTEQIERAVRRLRTVYEEVPRED